MDVSVMGPGSAVFKTSRVFPVANIFSTTLFGIFL